MRRHRVVVSFALASLAMAVACNGIIGLSGDYDLGGADAAVIPGTDGRVADAPTTTPQPDGRVVDVPDVTTPDGTTPDADAASDAAIAVEAEAGPPPFDASPPDTITPDSGAGKWCPTSPAVFCWDFFDDDPAPSYKWVPGATVSLPSDGVTLIVDGGVGTLERDLQASVTSGANASPFGALVWQFGSHTVDVGQSFAIDFSFRLTQANRFAIIAALATTSSTYGLAIHPDACSGVSCLSDNARGTGLPDEDHATGFVLNAWYVGRIALQRSATTSWTGTISVGGRTLGTPTSLTASGTSDLRLEVGVFGTDAAGGVTSVEIDNVSASIF